ncbi:hypothetical protein MJH54_29615, partial [Salmonella enterica subsp. enterica serovar Montevideo]|nr:hypothetical protein [Salmonella enterica subsp. enterica serovar Montevideo]
RATHLASGISVKVQSERSQHANKRLARLLIAWRLEQQRQNECVRPEIPVFWPARPCRDCSAS